jgi:hypothetical protein
VPAVIEAVGGFTKTKGGLIYKIAMFRALAFCLSFLVALFASAPWLYGAGNENYYHCVDREGNATVTNRHYDQARYTCTPFTDLNRAFKEVELRRKEHAAEAPAAVERDTVSASEAARTSAQSARLAMEAAQVSAEAAHITAEAAQRSFIPYYILVR